MNRISLFLLFGAFCIAPLVLPAPAQSQTTDSVSPRASYLRNVGNPPLAIDLSASGIVAGDALKLEMLGDFSYVGIPNEGILGGLFSSTTTAAGGIDFGVTDACLQEVPSWAGPDVPGDFLIAWVNQRGALPPDGGDDFRSIVVTVPAGAQFLLVALLDDNYRDNPNVDNDLAVRITAQAAGSSACGDPDEDGDGIFDSVDLCPGSDMSPTVVIDGCDSGVTNYTFADGCSLADLIEQARSGAKNHGQAASAVSHLTNKLKKDGLLTGAEKGAIQSCL